MNALTDTELGQMSRHLSGDAVDIQPIEPDTGHIKEATRALPGLRKFVDREGGLVRWHAEFNGERSQLPFRTATPYTSRSMVREEE